VRVHPLGGAQCVDYHCRIDSKKDESVETSITDFRALEMTTTQTFLHSIYIQYILAYPLTN